MPEKKKILIVDDDVQIVHALSLRLTAAGYSVIKAYDGVAGLQAARSDAPSAIVLDIRMPRTDGLAVLTQLKEAAATCDLPVVVLSGCESQKSAALEAGADFFMSKPYDAKILLSTLSAAVSARDIRSTRQDATAGALSQAESLWW